jgi:hypothetical protein
MKQSVINFINKYDALIDDEQWRELLINASGELLNSDIKDLVDAIHETLAPVDLSDIQWELYYEHLAERIGDLRIIMRGVQLWKLLDDYMFFGLDYTAVKYGLLDDANFEWKEIKLGNQTVDYKLVRWKGKAI